MALELATLVHDAEGAETAPPLLIAHGLFGSARNFNSLGKRMASNRRVVAVDMRNHGRSPWSDEMDYPAMAGDLAAAIERHCGGRAAVLGHSMGGKAAMMLALTRPELVDRLVVADIAPVTYPHSHGGYVAAMQALDLSAIARRADADPLLAPAVPEPGLRGFLLQNLVVEEGRARWRINLAVLDARMDALTGFPDTQASYAGPALFLYGTASDYVTPGSHAAIRARFPRAELQGMEGAAHWLHAERPEAFRAAVTGWLDTA
ncbi:alpha/beta fold hydrolase [Paralimibaculum aggregatum]|uniref:Alpha/beta fold hydrolase n=1 Tax=Paralimibaculum aggregatum TaxID=3036245 RepID=A0ABQ6LM22_9RHOB|nr:alpha/beta fold hydrolase [Limibaculum sp. NKW23]GMG82288.1 alpha/beta fold hydrolase [Limibaculum sp. NKW23]